MRFAMLVGFLCGLFFAVLFVSTLGKAKGASARLLDLAQRENSFEHIAIEATKQEPEEKGSVIIQESIQEESEQPVQQEIVNPLRSNPPGRWIRALVTVYTPWDEIDRNSGYQDGFTATMVNTRSTNPNHIYGIAADPRVLPYGTRIYVPGYWEALQRNRTSRPTEMMRVDDTGGTMRQNWSRHRIIHIDLRFRTQRGALNWLRSNAHLGEVDSRGRLWMNVFVYR